MSDLQIITPSDAPCSAGSGLVGACGSVLTHPVVGVPEFSAEKGAVVCTDRRKSDTPARSGDYASLNSHEGRLVRDSFLAGYGCQFCCWIAAERDNIP